MPKEGRDRAAYRAWKFGSVERMREADARVAQAAANVGLPFRQDLMLRTPNTIDAHRLIWFAGQNEVQDATMEAVFKAYFIEGRDIGDAAVLADCAAQAGLDRGSVAEFLAGDVAAKEMRAADQAAREAGVNGVPSFFLDGYGLFSGAMPAETMADALRRARRYCGSAPRHNARSAGPPLLLLRTPVIAGAQRRSNPLPDERSSVRQAGDCFGAARLAMTSTQ